MKNMSVGKMIISAIGAVILIVIVTLSGQIFENVGADEIVVIQSPVKGILEWYTTPGLKWQSFGKPTHYKKSFQYWFSKKSDQGDKSDQSISTRFNDGGHATISGSVRVDMPLDKDKLNPLHAKYGSQKALETDLIRPAFERSVYMSGPLMSSAESYSERRNQLIFYIEDQATIGVYKTTTKSEKKKDVLTGVEKTITVVDLMMDPKDPTVYLRSEVSPLQDFGLKAYNLSINAIDYDKEVEEQIRSQQRAIMQVQTAIAESRQAEQRKLTVEMEGAANAAKAEWEQKTIKAKLVTEAEQRFDIAEWDRKAAEKYKAKEILRGEGDGAYKRLVMEADGALAQKLETYEKVMGRFAQEFGKQKWVPEVSFGGGAGATGGDQVTNMMNLLSVGALKALGLDITIPQGQGMKIPQTK